MMTFQCETPKPDFPNMHARACRSLSYAGPFSCEDETTMKWVPNSRLSAAFSSQRQTTTDPSL